MSTKKVWLIILFALLLLGFRLYNYYDSRQMSGVIEVSGQVLTEPYLKNGQLNFRLERYFVVSDYQSLSFGDQIQVRGVLDQGKIKAEEVEVVSQTALAGWLTALRLKFNDQIQENLPDPQAQLLAGVVLGVKSNLDQDFKQDLVNTGTLHVVVVSGYNIALVAGMAVGLSIFIGRRKANILAAVLVILYTLLVGATAPTVRAAIMGILTLTAVLVGRQALAGYLLVLTGYIMLLVNPENLVDISFQLTFLATLGLIVFTKPISNFLQKLTKIVREPLSTTLAAQILVVPLIFFYFGNASLSAPLVNVLVLWTIPISTLGGFIYLFTLQFSAVVGSLIGFALLLPLTIFVEIVELFGSFEIFVIQAEKQNWLVLIGYFCLLLALVLYLGKRAYAVRNT